MACKGHWDGKSKLAYCQAAAYFFYRIFFCDKAYLPYVVQSITYFAFYKIGLPPNTERRKCISW